MEIDDGTFTGHHLTSTWKIFKSLNTSTLHKVELDRAMLIYVFLRHGHVPVIMEGMPHVCTKADTSYM